ncbi:hypothetical protein J6590_032187 [Homalodisca vitripennis]|nr:hypothetical protein J6590_032187 [Homalodisca vitripennis]
MCEGRQNPSDDIAAVIEQTRDQIMSIINTVRDSMVEQMVPEDVFPEVAVSSDQGNHLLNLIPAQPHQPSGEAGARISKQSFAECLSLVTLPPQAVCLPGPFVYTLVGTGQDTIDFGLKYGAVPSQTAAEGSSRGLTKHSISGSALNKRAIRVPDKALSYCWDVILRFPLISGVEVNREWLIEYELRSHYV